MPRSNEIGFGNKTSVSDGSDAEFNFVLNDGVHTSESYTMFVATKPVRLFIERNAALNVFPLTRKLISNKLLSTRCSDETREIKYAVRNGPHLGKIIMETSEGVWLNVTQFTQRDIDNGKVFYEHTKQFMDLSVNDSFTFDVEAHFSESLTNQASTRSRRVQNKKATVANARLRL